MKMKNIIGRLLATWAMVTFIITMLPSALFIFLIKSIEEPKRSYIFRRYSNGWMRVYFFITGCRLKIKGLDYFKTGENYIVVCNHNSLMDIPITTPFIPGANKTIAKAEMARIPIFGFIYKIGSVLVDRNDKNSRKESFVKMKEVLQMGIHMCIYPEGTRNRTQLPLKEFHDGAFKLAIDTGISIIPAIIFNTKKVLPPGVAFYFWPSKMELHFLAPVPANPSESYEKLKRRIREIMIDYYEANL
jgi:1-acyl-sn-glycerol-3-phosphate acyltransferase